MAGMTKLRKISCGRKLNKLIKNAYMHGVPISLLYKNRSSYRTLLGGYLSLFEIILIIGYMAYSINDV